MSKSDNETMFVLRRVNAEEAERLMGGIIDNDQLQCRKAIQETEFWLEEAAKRIGRKVISVYTKKGAKYTITKDDTRNYIIIPKPTTKWGWVTMLDDLTELKKEYRVTDEGAFSVPSLILYRFYNQIDIDYAHVVNVEELREDSVDLFGKIISEIKGPSDIVVDHDNEELDSIHELSNLKSALELALFCQHSSHSFCDCTFNCGLTVRIAMEPTPHPLNLADVQYTIYPAKEVLVPKDFWEDIVRFIREANLNIDNINVEFLCSAYPFAGASRKGKSSVTKIRYVKVSSLNQKVTLGEQQMKLLVQLLDGVDVDIMNKTKESLWNATIGLSSKRKSKENRENFSC